MVWIVHGKPGAIGHIPLYLGRNCLAPALVAFDYDKGSLPATRAVSAFAAASTSPDEAIAKVQKRCGERRQPLQASTDAAETEKRIPRERPRRG